MPPTATRINEGVSLFEERRCDLPGVLTLERPVGLR